MRNATAPRRWTASLPGRVSVLAALAATLGAAVIFGAVGAAIATGEQAGAGQHPRDPSDQPVAEPLPRRLSDTGLYEPGSTIAVRRGLIAFTPQYPLWSDGATKRRWIALPAGTSIDASDPNAWEFPRGTRLWKEFSMGRRVETRYIERLADGSWRFATYVWNEAGTDAELAPSGGIRALPVATAPRGRYAIPGEGDCRACHAGAAAPVLGFSALQLSSDRDPLAPHAQPAGAGDADLRVLVERGVVRNLSRSLVLRPPRIDAEMPETRAMLGYLHANCGHCHNRVESGAGVPVTLDLAHDVTGGRPGVVRTLRSMLDAPTRFRFVADGRSGIAPPAATETRHAPIVPGDAGASVLFARMRSRNPNTRMPPLGTAVVDESSLALVERWINLDPRKEMP